MPNRVSYMSSKAAVIGLTKSIAFDYMKHGIRANAICPGSVDSPSLHERAQALGDHDEVWKTFVARQPMGRMAQPDEMAHLAGLPRERRERLRDGCELHGGWRDHDVGEADTPGARPPMSERQVLEIAEAGHIEPVPVPAEPHGRPLFGVLMVMGAVLLFAGNDTITKLLVTQYPVPLVSAIRYIVHLLLMVVLLLPRMGSRLLKTERTGLVLLRALTLAAASLTMGAGAALHAGRRDRGDHLPVALAVMLLAVPLLGER